MEIITSDKKLNEIRKMAIALQLHFNALKTLMLTDVGNLS
jgi:hypothetical protein